MSFGVVLTQARADTVRFFLSILVFCSCAIRTIGFTVKKSGRARLRNIHGEVINTLASVTKQYTQVLE